MGTTQTYKGQLYWVADTFMHERKDGTLAVILVWASQCLECGDEFRFTQPALAEKFAPNRRCQKHKRPGVQVNVG